MEDKELGIKPYIIMTMLCVRQCIDLIEKGKTIKDINTEEFIEKRLMSANVYLNLLAEYLNYDIPSKENYNSFLKNE